MLVESTVHGKQLAKTCFCISVTYCLYHHFFAIAYDMITQREFLQGSDRRTSYHIFRGQSNTFIIHNQSVSP